MAEKEIEELHPVQIEFEKKSKLYQRAFVENQQYKAQLFENMQTAQAAQAENNRLSQELDQAFALSEEFAAQCDTAKSQIELLLQTLVNHNIPSPLA